MDLALISPPKLVIDSFWSHLPLTGEGLVIRGARSARPADVAAEREIKLGERVDAMIGDDFVVEVPKMLGSFRASSEPSSRDLARHVA